MRQMVSVHVVDMDRYGDDERPPEGLLEFLAWASGVVENIPPEFRETAKIEISSESGWEDSHSPSICISYGRPETDVEMAKREAGELQRAAERERHERYQYEALRRKYEYDHQEPPK